MLSAIRARVLPENQRRTFQELTSDLDLNEGDLRSKRSAYWTMLFLAACIASAGIIADSTATVIGAMIIAPLSTPIMGTALALVKREQTGGVKFVVLGGLLVIAVGALFSLMLPSPYDLLGNSQVASRTSPRLVDLLSALATGFAGAIALARRDVAAILPGVAISISLVPPLCVVGICLAEGSPSLAFGALVLFLSNFLALVFAGSLVFTTLGYTQSVRQQGGGPRRKVRVTFAVLVVLVLAPVILNSLVGLAISKLTDIGAESTRAWLASTRGAEILDVTNKGFSLVIQVRAPIDLPSTTTLMNDLSSRLPAGIPVVLDRSVGQSIDLGSTT
jgi:uncharacterized hydrophobic protein (TIGR00271 family)